jgi:hypothetical protein
VVTVRHLGMFLADPLDASAELVVMRIARQVRRTESASASGFGVRAHQLPAICLVVTRMRLKKFVVAMFTTKAASAFSS